MLYLANGGKVIDALQGVTTIINTEDGRVVQYNTELTKNLNVQGSFILDSNDRGILDSNLLDLNQNQFRYFTIEQSPYTQNHKLIFVHATDEYAKILGFGFVYIYGKSPRNFTNSL